MNQPNEGILLWDCTYERMPRTGPRALMQLVTRVPGMRKKRIVRKESQKPRP